MKPLLLDCFSGAGGAAKGYQQAGFYVVGVDIKAQPRYSGDEFHQADALEFIAAHGREFDVIHTSPPCQSFSWVTPKAHKPKHPDLIAPVRQLLQGTGKPYVIENVGGARAQLINPVKLCGSMFSLKTHRHRYFEIYPNVLLLTPPCQHDFEPLLVTTAGSNSRAIREKGNYKSVKNAALAYGIDWMNCEELKEAIPPAYTKWIGGRLLARLK